MDNTELICLSSNSEIENDIYLKQAYKKMIQSVKMFFGMFDSKTNIDFSKQKGDVYTSFVATMLHNMFLRFGFYEWKKDDFLKLMDDIYTRNQQRYEVADLNDLDDNIKKEYVKQKSLLNIK